MGALGVEEGSGLGLGAEQLGEQMREFILADITHNILDQTSVIFGTVKEGILELLDSRLEAFRTEIAARKLGAPMRPNVYGSLGSLGREDPVVSSHHQGSDVGYAPFLQESPLHDWIAVEVTRAVREELPNIIERVTD